MNENVITLKECVEALGVWLGPGRNDTQSLPAPGYMDVMDIVWWQTGLSPAKYDAEPIPDMAAWRIVRRG